MVSAGTQGATALGTVMLQGSACSINGAHALVQQARPGCHSCTHAVTAASASHHCVQQSSNSIPSSPKLTIQVSLKFVDDTMATKTAVNVGIF